MMKLGSLFTGIGGLDLGLERAGFEVEWQVEIDPFCRRVLARHWPNVARYEDVRTLEVEKLVPVDLVAGGFPCQDVSVAGRGAGIDGARSGLWAEFERIVRGVRPRYVLVENSPALLARGFGRVIGDLAALGYDAIWDCIPARAFGAHHVRDRLFLVAFSSSDADGAKLRFGAERDQWPGWRVRAPVGPDPEPLVGGEVDGWEARPPLARVDYGLPRRLDEARYRALGNAIVPQVAEWLGRMILATR